MSEEQLKAFIAKVQEDSSLQEQLKEEGADVIAIAKAAGFSVAKEDLASYRENLSDEDLEAAAGGGQLEGAACSTFLTPVSLCVWFTDLLLGSLLLLH